MYSSIDDKISLFSLTDVKAVLCSRRSHAGDKETWQHGDRRLHQPKRLSPDPSHTRGHGHHPLADRQTGGGGTDLQGASIRELFELVHSVCQLFENVYIGFKCIWLNLQILFYILAHDYGASDSLKCHF